jgi:hypothetical protein
MVTVSTTTCDRCGAKIKDRVSALYLYDYRSSMPLTPSRDFCFKCTKVIIKDISDILNNKCG